MRVARAVVVAFILACGVRDARAQVKDWPARPVRMVHGFIAGGAVDIAARLVATAMLEALGQQVIVDGRPGAGGTVGGVVSDSSGHPHESRAL